MTLAVIQHPGEDLPAQLRSVAVSPLDERVLAFGLDAFEQSIHRRAMHRDRAVSPGFRSSHPLLNLPDNLPPGSPLVLVVSVVAAVDLVFLAFPQVAASSRAITSIISHS